MGGGGGPFIEQMNRNHGFTPMVYTHLFQTGKYKICPRFSSLATMSYTKGLLAFLMKLNEAGEPNSS